MPRKIAEDDFIVVETNAELQALGLVRETVFSSKKFKAVPLRLFAGRFFDTWYELLDGQLADFGGTEARSDEDPSAQKSRARRDRKRRRLLRARALCPAVLVEYYALRDHAAIGYIRHAELSYMLLFARPGERLLVLDARKGLFAYAALFRDPRADVTAITRSDYFVLRHTAGCLKTIAPHAKAEAKYGVFFVVACCDVLPVLEFYADNFYQAVVYASSRVLATRVFCALLASPRYVDVQMADFFCREFQTDGHVHPLVRGDTGSGYVVSAVRVAA